jgi:L-alanine-DL-glutamate epimerase-like enolase superfamily enzyme
MVDVNGRWDLPTAISMAHRLADSDVLWIEEPLWFDDVQGHARLANSIDTPIAVGEQLYKVEDFRDFISAGAVHYVQASAVRLGGVTPWWQVADLAYAYHLPVVPHVGDMLQIHQHLSIAHPSIRLMEYIPWLRECFVHPATVIDGRFAPPRAPGASTTLRPDALLEFDVVKR